MTFHACDVDGIIFANVTDSCCSPVALWSLHSRVILTVCAPRYCSWVCSSTNIDIHSALYSTTQHFCLSFCVWRFKMCIQSYCMKERSVTWSVSFHMLQIFPLWFRLSVSVTACFIYNLRITWTWYVLWIWIWCHMKNWNFFLGISERHWKTLKTFWAVLSRTITLVLLRWSKEQ